MNKLGFHVNRVSDEVYDAIIKVRPKGHQDAAPRRELLAASERGASRDASGGPGSMSRTSSMLLIQTCGDWNSPKRCWGRRSTSTG